MITAQAAAAGDPPRVGERAPDFELRDANLRQVRLVDFRGQRNVVLVFYPFAFTRVCSGELSAIGDQLETLQGEDRQVLAVSCDAPASLRAFAESRSLSYPLLSDFWPHGAVARAYGVFDEALGAAMRGSFVIDKEGIVRWRVINGLKDARNVADYQEALAALG